MYCSNCGKKIEEDDKFCSSCGFEIKSKEEKKESNIEESTKPVANTSNNDITIDTSIEPQKSEIPTPKAINESQKAQNFANIIYNENTTANLDKPSSYAYQEIPNNGNYTSNYQQPKNGIGKVLKRLITIFIILLLITTATILVINKDKIFNFNKSNRTIMIYMVGSDLETKYAAASTDINEMIKSEADFENVNVLLYTGGAKRWHNQDIPSDKNAIFKVTSEGLEKIEEYEISEMGDSENLTFFLDYGYENFKASQYSLILWDHGGGPIYGYGLDEYNKSNSLTLLELKTALSKSEFDATNKLEFIGFDACLMSTAEIAFAISDYADYMIASQEVEPGDGWNYAFLKSIEKNTTTDELGKSIIDSYSSFYKKRLSGKGISLSLLKLNKMEAFEKSLNSLFADVDDNLLIDFSTISRSRSISKTFGKTSASGYDLVDLYDLIDKLPSKYYKKVSDLKSTIEDVVVYQKTDLLNTNGISIYFPYENKTDIEEIMYLYDYFNFASSYTEFIDNFSSRLTGTRLHNWKLSENVPVSEEVGEISVEVPKEVIQNYSSANYIIFEKMDDDYYMPIYKGTDIVVNGNTISTTMTKKALVATTDDGEKVYITTVESEKGTDYTKYIIPGALQNWDEDNFFETFDMISIYVQLIVDEENPNGVIAAAVPIINETDESQVSPKLTINIKDWKIIQLLTYKYKIFDEQGNYTTDWVGSGEVTGIEANTNEDFSLEFEDLDVSKDYYCLFRIMDSQGNVYTTNVVKVKDN